MNRNRLFAQALGLPAQWQVTGLHYDFTTGRLEVTVDLRPGGLPTCALCAQLCELHNSPEEQWHHLNFFEHQTCVRVRMLQARCPRHGIKIAALPPVRPGAGFALLIDAYVLKMTAQRTEQQGARTSNQHVWRSRVAASAATDRPYSTSRLHLGREHWRRRVPGGTRKME